jgi:hypothetical protein
MFKTKVATKKSTISSRYMKKAYPDVTNEFVNEMDERFNGKPSYYIEQLLGFIEEMYDTFGLPIHQKRFGQKRATFRLYDINLTQLLNLLHKEKRLVQIMVMSGSLLYFPAKVLDTMSNEELLGLALEADDEMRSKQIERIRETTKRNHAERRKAKVSNGSECD